jgi:hypothetical protein
MYPIIYLFIELVIIDELIIILNNWFNSLWNIPNLDKYLFDYFLIIIFNDKLIIWITFIYSY